MTHAIRIHQYGGPEVLSWDEVDVGEPASGEVKLRHTAIGLNFIDVYQRTGLYPVGDFPQALGMEAAGIVVAVGEGVPDLSPGDRVAYAMVLGAYTTERLIDADKLVKLPDSIDDETAAAMMLQGMTARYLLKNSYPVRSGDVVLLMAAAGGVGTLLSQWARHLGVTVIGCVGSEEKAKLAQAQGCHHTILYQEEDVAARVRDITGGEGVAAVYDSVGQATLMASLDSLRPTGTLVSFGSASGPITDFNIGLLAQKGSLYIQRPTLGTYIRNRALLIESAKDLMGVVAQGAVKVQIGQRYSLADTAQAHQDLEARQTTGATVLLP
ncbi:quinone oxidoreductase family protein [Sedimenticola selenatireducens]|uniref:NADPH:quinone reductase n=1 Tax=Sedimenticola selenatireducens TaxID=191960 RepID=A0A558DYU7_9GAMM|nr:quinone oxidoreductase [Sedimenticola selenatireducens]TVO71891.1 quinone oxidoreductase [Sedimenticola selenatireducens]TVT66271.1 MAG: quinone oxidoreductase [Sedimenticola selenatireducens]